MSIECCNFNNGYRLGALWTENLLDALLVQAGKGVVPETNVAGPTGDLSWQELTSKRYKEALDLTSSGDNRLAIHKLMIFHEGLRPAVAFFLAYF